MKITEKIVTSVTQPQQTNVLWHNPETGKLKIFGNTGWEVVGGGSVTKKEHIGSATILPNVYNVFGTVTGEITITKGKEKSNVVNNYIIRFIAGDERSIVFNGWELVWAGNNIPTFEVGKIYEIQIIDNLAIYINS